MKKFFFSILLSVMTVAINVKAESKQDLPAVSMVSYEQSWLDYKGTIALKNNTSEEIHSVSFMLEYLDMQGTPMDYEKYTIQIDIEPGKTKKIDIPAYEHNRNYYYYKSEAGYNNTPFKLRYEFRDYNLETLNSAPDTYDSVYNNDVPQSPSDNSFLGGFESIFMLLFLGFYFGMFVMVPVMAKKRNRNPAVWLLLSFIATPILIGIVLLAIGKE